MAGFEVIIYGRIWVITEGIPVGDFPHRRIGYTDRWPLGTAAEFPVTGFEYVMVRRPVASKE